VNSCTCSLRSWVCGVGGATVSPGALGLTGKHSKTMKNRLCVCVCMWGGGVMSTGKCVPMDARGQLWELAFAFLLRQCLSCCSPQHTPGWLVREYPGSSLVSTRILLGDMAQGLLMLLPCSAVHRLWVQTQLLSCAASTFTH
jgi:hypothetical protein